MEKCGSSVDLAHLFPFFGKMKKHQFVNEVFEPKKEMACVIMCKMFIIREPSLLPDFWEIPRLDDVKKDALYVRSSVIME